MGRIVRRNLELGGSRLRRGVVPAGPARARPAAVVRGALRRAWSSTRPSTPSPATAPVARWAEVDARRASPSTSSSTGCCRATRRALDSLPNRLREEARRRRRAAASCSTTALEAAVADATARGGRAADRGRQARRRSCSSSRPPSAPRDHALDELAPLLERARAAPRRGRAAPPVAGRAATGSRRRSRWLEDARRRVGRRRRPARRRTSRSCRRSTRSPTRASPTSARTAATPRATSRPHASRSASRWRYADEELRGDRRAARRSWPGKAETVRLMFNNNRGADAPVAARADARAARPGAGERLSPARARPWRRLASPR